MNDTKTPKHCILAFLTKHPIPCRFNVLEIAPLTPPLMVLLLRGLLLLLFLLLLLLPRPGMDRNVKLRWLRANPTDENMNMKTSCAPTAHTHTPFGWQFAGGPISVSII